VPYNPIQHILLIIKENHIYDDDIGTLQTKAGAKVEPPVGIAAGSLSALAAPV